MSVCNVTAPNGSLYIFQRMKVETVERLKRDEKYRDCLLCYAFRKGMKPVAGPKYYNPIWETVYPVKIKPAALQTAGEIPTSVVNLREEPRQDLNIADNKDDIKSPPKKRAALSPECSEELKQITVPMQNTVTNSEGADLCTALYNCSPFKDMHFQEIHHTPLIEQHASRGTKKELFYDSQEHRPSATVKVCNLPKKFYENHFRSTLNEELCNLLSLDEGEEPAIFCSEMDEHHSVLVEFRNPGEARSACLLHMNYGGKFLSFVQQPKDREHNSTWQELGTSAKISNLPKKFFKEHFQFTLNEELCKLLFLDEGEEPAICCSEMDEHHSVLVEFRNPDEARSACLLHMNYGGKFLSFVQQPKDREYNSTCQELGTSVKISNLPKKFFKEHFQFTLNEKLCNLLSLDEEEEPVKSCSEMDEHQSVLVEFRNAEEARSACLLDLTYGGTVPTFVHLNPSIANAQEVVSSVYSECDSIGSCSTSSGVLPVGAKYRSDWPTYSTLMLLSICIKESTLLRSRSTRNIGLGYKNVFTFMMANELHYTQNTIKKHIKGLTMMYEAKNPKWEFHSFMAEYLGEAPIGSSKITEAIATCKRPNASDNISKPHSKKNKYHCGVLTLEDCLIEDNSSLFSLESDLLLIAEYKDKKHIFDDDKNRASEVYEKIEKVFQNHGYKHKRSDLAKRMAWLGSEWRKRYDAILNRTGSGSDAQKWEYYDVLSQLFEKSVVAQPQKLVSLGNENTVTSRGARNIRSTGKKSSGLSPTESFRAQRLEVGKGIRDEVQELSAFIRQRFT